MRTVMAVIGLYLLIIVDEVSILSGNQLPKLVMAILASILGLGVANLIDEWHQEKRKSKGRPR